MRDMQEFSREDQRAWYRARRDSATRAIRIWPGPPGSGEFGEGNPNIQLWPEKDGAVLTIPERFKNSAYVVLSDRGGVKNISRFFIGNAECQHLVRFMWDDDLHAPCLRLPSSPAARPFIIWVPNDWDDEERR